MNKLLTTISLVANFSITACTSSELEDYETLEFTVVGHEIIGEGIIDSTSLSLFKKAIETAPDAKTLVLKNVGGSVNDEANRIFASFVHSQGFATHVPGNGMVASGGTDLFLAGVSRTIEKGACIGVHSWAAGTNENSLRGNQVPRDHDLHKPYLTYYDYVGIPRSFYWFTLEAAPADSMHWMSREKVIEYKMTTQPPGDLSSDPICNER